MSKTGALIAYALLVMLFAVLFKYGIHISFGVDPGYVGPIMLWHAFIIIIAITKSPVKK